MASPLLRLLWLTSPALPIGAYAYSRGLEFAVHAGWVRNAATTEAWIAGVLDHQVTTLDGPVLLRLYDAFQQDDWAEVARWCEFLNAARVEWLPPIRYLRYSTNIEKELRTN